MPCQCNRRKKNNEKLHTRFKTHVKIIEKRGTSTHRPLSRNESTSNWKRNSSDFCFFLCITKAIRWFPIIWCTFKMPFSREDTSLTTKFCFASLLSSLCCSAGNLLVYSAHFAGADQDDYERLKRNTKSKNWFWPSTKSMQHASNGNCCCR